MTHNHASILLPYLGDGLRGVNLFYMLMIVSAAYRLVNTLDAMWGYRNQCYQAFGWCAVKVDDIANWVPARITVRLMLWVGRSSQWSTIKEQAITHASPNAGWPEVALAYAADVQPVSHHDT